MAIENSVEITLSYKNRDQQRQYTFSDVPATSVATLESALIGINASITAGTDDGLKEVFVADDVNTVTGDGYLQAITAAKLTSVEEIFIFGGES